jgi:hypothetical protein
MSEEQRVDVPAMAGKSSAEDLNHSTSIDNDPELEDLIPQFVDQIGEDTVKSLIATKEIKHGDQDVGLNTFSRRFLRAEKKNLGKAVARAKSHAKWRLEAIPRGYIFEVGLYAWARKLKFVGTCIPCMQGCYGIVYHVIFPTIEQYQMHCIIIEM